MEQTLFWRYGGGASAAVVRAQLTLASTFEHAQRRVERWKQDLSLYECLPPIRQTEGRWPYRQLRTSDLCTPRWALCLSSHQMCVCITADEPWDFILCPGLTKSSPKERSRVATKTFPFHFLAWRKIWLFYFLFFRAFLVSLWKMSFE